jgi:hypothetical protein
MAAVRELLLATGGYESKEVGGMVMAVFDRPAAALEWALALQLALLRVPWPSDLGLLAATAEVHAMLAATPAALRGLGAAPLAAGRGTSLSAVAQPEPAAMEASRPRSAGDLAATEAPGGGSGAPEPRLLFSGLRARVGLFHGPIDRVLPVRG